MSVKPEDYQQVEILIDGKWVKATFHPADYWFDGDDEGWCMDYFMTEGGDEYPLAQSGDLLPMWRTLT